MWFNNSLLPRLTKKFHKQFFRIQICVEAVSQIQRLGAALCTKLSNRFLYRFTNAISNQTNEAKVQNTNFFKAQTKERTTKQIYSTNTNPKVPAQTKQIPIVVAQLESYPNN